MFGPKPRDYSYTVPKKVKKAALRSALSSKLGDGQVTVVEHFDLPEVKTKGFVKVLKTFGIDNVLVVVDGDNDTLRRSARNVPHVKVLKAEGLNVYDVLKYRALVLTKGTIEKIAVALDEGQGEGHGASAA